MSGQESFAPMREPRFEPAGRSWQAEAAESRAPAWMIGALVTAWAAARVLLWWRPELVLALG